MAFEMIWYRIGFTVFMLRATAPVLCFGYLLRHNLPSIGYHALSTILQNGAKGSELVEVSKTPEPNIDQIIQDLPTEDKYALLIQSYGSKLEDDGFKNATLIDSMERLVEEMADQRLLPNDRTAQVYLNSAAAFCEIRRMTQAVRSLKGLSKLKAFGASNGQLTPPTAQSAKGRWVEVTVPSDDREREVQLALAAMTTAVSWLLLQFGGLFADDLHPWATLLGCVAVLLAVIDVIVRQGQELKQAVAGIERLTINDVARETHVEAAGFLAGYVLGLPCFCYRPDLGESLRMLKDFPASLTAYQRQGLRPVSSSVITEVDAGWMDLVQQIKQAVNSSVTDQQTSSSSQPVPKRDNENKIEDWRTDEDISSYSKQRLFHVGRILVWLLTPVAAEQLKYGHTLFADPRRARRLLDVLSTAPLKQEINYQEILPTSAADRQALLQWAYFEATVLVRQYGDLLEQLALYLRSGTSSVGECALLIEKTLT